MAIISITKSSDDAQAKPDVAPPSHAERVYSVPRRFDLATILTVTLAYSLLFGLLNFLTAHWVAYAFLGLLTVVVAAAQAWVESPRWVRKASILAGAVYTSCWAVGIYLVMATAGSRYPQFEFPMLAMVALGGGVFGMLLGYLAGAVDGGIFLIAEVVRNHWPGTQLPSDSPEEPATEDAPQPLQ